MTRTPDPLALWQETAAAGQAAAATITMRNMMLLQSMWTGDWSDREYHRMVMEKGNAAGAGALAWLTAAPAMMAALYSPPQFWKRLAGANYALARPAMKTARANAKRLSRRRSRKTR